MPGSTSSIVGFEDGISGAAKDGAAGAKSSAKARTRKRNISTPLIMICRPLELELVLDVRLRAIRTARGLRVPTTLFVFVFYGFSVAGHPLLFGGRLRGGERVGMGWIGLRN